jgi:hypothetical protein
MEKCVSRYDTVAYAAILEDAKVQEQTLLQFAIEGYSYARNIPYCPVYGIGRKRTPGDLEIDPAGSRIFCVQIFMKIFVTDDWLKS